MDPAELPLILLPGLHGSVRLFDDLVARLRKQFPRRKILPLPLPTDTPQDYPSLRDHFLAQLEKQGPFALLAESFSAPLALHLAASPGLRIERMVLAGAYCNAPRCPALRLLPLRRLFAVRPPKQAIRHFLTGKHASEELVNAVRTEIQAAPADALAGRVRTALSLKETDLPPAHPIPTLLLHARHDAMLPQNTRAALEHHLPDAKISWIDAPHLLLQAAPAACAETIGRFMR